jgi:hypothetical protein
MKLDMGSRLASDLNKRVQSSICFSRRGILKLIGAISICKLRRDPTIYAECERRFDETRISNCTKISVLLQDIPISWCPPSYIASSAITLFILCHSSSNQDADGAGPHFGASLNFTVPILFACSSQYFAIRVSLSESPWGTCVVQCTVRDPYFCRLLGTHCNSTSNNSLPLS